MAFFREKILEMFMTANFYAFEQEKRWVERIETAIKGNLAEEKADVVKKNGVPDTAHDCPVLRTGVACEKPVTEIKILCKGE